MGGEGDDRGHEAGGMLSPAAVVCLATAEDDDEGEEGEYVRVFVNDEAQEMAFCGGTKEKGGMCELGRFVESQAYARHSGYGDFGKCFD